MKIPKDTRSSESKHTKEPDYENIHFDAMLRSYARYKNGKNRTDLIKTVYHGVRSAILYDKHTDSLEILFFRHEFIKRCIAKLIPNELIQIFPVKKIYDGEKWQSKDYFSTMEALREHGLNKPIGKEVDSLLWDYMNDDLMDFRVNDMYIVSKLYKAENGIDPFVKFFEENNLAPYKMTATPDGKRYLTDCETGRTISINSTPSGFKLVKCGRNPAE